MFIQCEFSARELDLIQSAIDVIIDSFDEDISRSQQAGSPDNFIKELLDERKEIYVLNKKIDMIKLGVIKSLLIPSSYKDIN